MTTLLVLEVKTKVRDSAGEIEQVWIGHFQPSDLQIALALHDTAAHGNASETVLFALGENDKRLPLKTKLDYERNLRDQAARPQGILIPMPGSDFPQR